MADENWAQLELGMFPVPIEGPLKVSGPGGSRNDDGGAVVGLDEPDQFYARLTSRLNAAYGWEEVIPATGGTWADPVGQRTGSTTVNPAYDVNGSAVIGLPTIVVMRPGAWGGNTAGQEYVFSHCCVGTVSGSGSGGGPTQVATGCCGNELPTTLTATFTNLSGCACSTGTTITLTWNGSWWSGSATVAGCSGTPTAYVDLICSSGSWQLFYGNSADGSTSADIEYPVTSFVCDPLSVTSEVSARMSGPCSGGSISITVTE